MDLYVDLNVNKFIVSINDELCLLDNFMSLLSIINHSVIQRYAKIHGMYIDYL